MKEFLDDNFLLHSSTAEWLYHEHAKNLPIIDYHCHLPVAEIATDHQFENLTKIWLNGDHYKWRAMRTHGIEEKYCTGEASDWEKFAKWAETVPFTLRNPLYHWTHMELKNPFGINKLLDSDSALTIWRECGSMLQSKEFSTRNILRKMKVEVICTTDDPIDKLDYHKKINSDNFEVKVLPTWRPDRAMNIENPEEYEKYVSKLEKAADMEIRDYNDLLVALQKRHDYFHSCGCRLSDHGLETMYADDYSESEIQRIFIKMRRPEFPDQSEIRKFKSALLLHFALMDYETGWTQQFHLGALRNNSTRMANQLGNDSGFDSIGDFDQALPLTRFLDRLDRQNKLTKTILYNLNPRDNELFATMCGNFNDGSVAGKVQFGSAWWFLDQRDGVEKQLNALSNLGLLSHFVGMLTDSRSFLSFPRHEYFRRILCNIVGKEVENGEIPNDKKLLAKTIEGICYYNAKNYFGF
jgi:glucuronate isomerase